MMRLIFFLLFVSLTSFSLFAQTSLEGRIEDWKTGEAFIGANISLSKNGIQLMETRTDFGGSYQLILDPGIYDLAISHPTFPPQNITRLVVKAGQKNQLDFSFDQNDARITLNGLPFQKHKVPLNPQDNTTTGKTITSEQIRNLPTKDINAIAATPSRCFPSSAEGDAISVRCHEDCIVYIDGHRICFNAISEQLAVELQMPMSGTPAESSGDPVPVYSLEDMSVQQRNSFFLFQNISL